MSVTKIAPKTALEAA